MDKSDESNSGYVTLEYQGQRLNPMYTKPTAKHGGSIMIWSCVSGYSYIQFKI